MASQGENQPAVISSIELRLASIESKLGILHGAQRIPEPDIQSRLKDLKALYEAKTDEAFRESCSESDRLMRELDAGTALTHQTSVSSTPLYYRRQEVLASADSLKQDMDQLSQMLNLLLVSQPPRDESKGPLREEEVTNAPIVNLTPVSREDEKRLDVLQANVAELQSRTRNVAGRVDSLLNLYYSLMSTSSEKMVLADEELSARERKK
jgi:hypothetical protein